jgi:hypothetical protein
MLMMMPRAQMTVHPGPMRTTIFRTPWLLLQPQIKSKWPRGTYTPDLGGGNTPGDRQATFQLISGVTIEGSYAGIGTNDPNVHDYDLYETILSGDLNSDDAEVADTEDLLDEPTRAENSYHVVTGSFMDQTAVLDGFIITTGFFRLSDSSDDPRGGSGMRIETGSPTIKSCSFLNNRAFGGSAGLFNFNDSNPILVDCTFQNNISLDGAITNMGSSPIIANCTFENNNTGIDNQEGSNPVLNNCTFENNRTGMENRDESNPTITDCVFKNNDRYGMENRFSSFILTNCIFENNNDGAMYNIICNLTLSKLSHFL